ncbi:ABC transporter substrate-binding protein [Nodularia spumigena]|uniref:ABC transporter substrate-binding protein n=1 Tax=Nodularia spumigena TaxID=70799 RepID=UPI002B1F14DA|nr:extracellular solute-binding protein [Nodularia spumigena]MEA5615380.1 extracellular solute-binding protein [Nodularia spumigena UHCC 0040]
MRIVTLLTAARGLSLGLWVMIGLMALSVGVLFKARRDTGDAVVFWLFSPEHKLLYVPLLEQAEGGMDRPLDMQLMSVAAIERRMMSGFFGGLPTADLIEVERAVVGRVFTGPLESVGFLDLTDRLRDEGLLDEINPPSFGPVTSRGRIFGLPHDVHPVLLAYRSDIVEAAGIDLSTVETWDDFFAAMAPLMKDNDGNGEPDRYALSFWPTQLDNIEVLLLQGGGTLFDEQDRPVIDTPRNAELLAKMVSWCVGPDRVAVDIDDFSATGHQQRVDGYAIAYLAPDWMCGIWKMHVPKLAGTVKVMPMPAFEPGGRRTSVRGGTVLGIPKDASDVDAAWEYAKMLYTSPEVARQMYELTDIISPVSSLWDDPVYHQPDPFFSGQAKGKLYIEQAPHVPTRTSSPYNRQAVFLLRDAAVALSEFARREGVYDAQTLEAEAARLLAGVQARMVRVMERNAFSAVGSEPEEPR